MHKIKVEDAGRLEVDLPDGNTVTLDLIRIRNDLVEVKNATDGKPASEYLDAVVECLKKHGLPTVTHHMANHFIGEVNRCVRELTKVDGPFVGTPASPASTDSTPSDSPTPKP